MSKYIIDLRPDCKVVQQICVSDDNVGVGARSVELFDALTDDYVKENFKDLLEGEYQRGLNDAWECARKLFSTMSETEIEKVFPTEWENGFYGLMQMKPQYAIAKLKAHEEKQDDKPIIGEVVERYLNGKRDGVGVFLGEDGDYWNCLFWTGAIFGTFAYPSNQFKRTGNVCNITEILEAMKA